MATVRTTTINVTKPASYDILADQFTLIRYKLPRVALESKSKKTYAQIHSELKDQLDHPYKTFQFDKLDGPSWWVVYVLYPKSASVKQVQIMDETMEQREVGFHEPELHLILKLLQVDFFQNHKEGRFVGQHDCYVYAKSDRAKRRHICLKIELKGDPHTENIFKVIGIANSFGTVPKEKINAYEPCFVISGYRDGVHYFSQLKSSAMHNITQQDLYVRRTYEGERTTLDYHHRDDIEQSRGYLLDRFIRAFKTYLEHYGFGVQHIERDFQEFKTVSATNFDLPVHLLEQVFVYDNRINKQHPLEHYLKRFQEYFPYLQFVPISELETEFLGAVLVIQDCEKKAFDEGQPLYYRKHSDPYKALYRKFPNVTKQSFNVNPNEAEDSDSVTYLQYPLELAKDENAFQVAINQLFLKDLILRKRNIIERLSPLLSGFIFIRKLTSNGQKYETALNIEDDNVRWWDLRDPRVKEDFINALQIKWEINWDNCYAKMSRFSNDDGSLKDLPSYDIILGPNLFVQIEDLNERILYEYNKIIERTAEIHAKLPIDEFKLAAQYIEESSPKELERLYRLDELFDEIGLYEPMMSFDELTHHERWWPQIAQILEISPSPNGTYRVTKFKNLYERKGMFQGSVKGTDVIPTYTGIWWDDDYRYLVGDVYGLNKRQARAHLVRQFRILQRADSFDIRPFLESMSVQFVRHKQYTVLPYYFHLIDLYNEVVLSQI